MEEIDNLELVDDISNIIQEGFDALDEPGDISARVIEFLLDNYSVEKKVWTVSSESI